MAKKVEEGSNSDEALRGYMENHAKFDRQIDAIRGKQKDNLNDAKKAGFLKTAIRKAHKELTESEEQSQVRKEIADATKHYVEIAADLFAHAEKEEAA